MKRLTSALLVIAFFFTQTVARAGTFDFNSRFNQLAHEISQSNLSANELIEKSKKAVIEAKDAGLTEQDLLTKLSEKMSLGLSEEEIHSSVEELRSNPSQDKIQELAQQINQNQNGDKFIQVLITFALLSLLWVGIFFILAAPYPR